MKLASTDNCSFPSPWTTERSVACSIGTHREQHRLKESENTLHVHTWSMICGKTHLPLSTFPMDRRFSCILSIYLESQRRRQKFCLVSYSARLVALEKNWLSWGRSQFPWKAAHNAPCSIKFHRRSSSCLSREGHCNGCIWSSFCDKRPHRQKSFRRSEQFYRKPCTSVGYRWKPFIYFFVFILLSH